MSKLMLAFVPIIKVTQKKGDQLFSMNNLDPSK